MNELKVARKLGWFSIALGLGELAAGGELGRALGVEDRSGLIRLFGLREIGTGVAILAQDTPTLGVWSRVAGDLLDLGALAAAYTDDNPRRGAVAGAMAAVAGITCVDYWCARRLMSARPHGSLRVHRQFVADYPSRRTASGAFPAAGR